VLPRPDRLERTRGRDEERNRVQVRRKGALRGDNRDMTTPDVPAGGNFAGAGEIGRGRPIADVRTVLERADWTELESRHHRDVDAMTAGHRLRASEQHTHPVEDFLFTYYSLRPAQLRRWHPGAGVALADARERAEWPFHRMISGPGRLAEAVEVNTDHFLLARGRSVGFIQKLLANTGRATPQFGCFGLHEWAMVFQSGDLRHVGWPLRLGAGGTDDVIRSHQIRCSHFDAFRFFTPAAKPRNLLDPDLASRDRMEQPGCLHASMDLYKWAYRMLPVVPSSLLVDCFRLARAIREVDMRASPYDLSDLGYPPIPIETAAGKAEYVAAQRDFASAGQLLRGRLAAELALAFGGGTAIIPAATSDAGPVTQSAARRRLRGGPGTAP